MRLSPCVLLLTLLIIPFGNCGAQSATAPTVASVAKRVNESFRKMEPLPRDILADVVEVTHTPAMANDPERVTREQLGTSDLAALKKALPDLAFQVLESKNSANGFVTTLKIRGSRKSGQLFSTQIVLDFKVTRGLITSFDAKQDPTERAALGPSASRHRGGVVAGSHLDRGMAGGGPDRRLSHVHP